MDENLAWKIVYAAAIFSLLILALAYYLISPRESTFFNSEKIERLAEFRNTKVEGRKAGRKAWEFYAREGWSEKSLAATYLKDVRQGKIYSDGKLSVRNLSAAQVKVDRQASVIEASGGVVMQTSEGKIFADQVSFYPNEKRAVLSNKIRVIRSNGLAETATAEYLSEPGQLNADNGIKLDLKEGSIRTRIKASRATLFMAVEKDIPLSGSLEVSQGKKAAVADEGLYSRKRNGLQLKGKTRTLLTKGAAHRLEEKTIVTADEMFFSTKTGDARASGSVEAVQKTKRARSDLAIYDDKSELLTLSGNVYLKKGEDWIACREVIISVKKQTFEAIGVEEAKFKI